MSGKGRFKGHIYRACLPAKLYLATMRFQTDKELGKAYAALQLHIAGLYHYNYIDKETFEVYTARYSQPLTFEEPQPLTLEQIETQKKFKELEKTFSNAIKQWSTMAEKSKKYYIKKAKEYEAIIPNAKLILSLANGERQ